MTVCQLPDCMIQGALWFLLLSSTCATTTRACLGSPAKGWKTCGAEPSHPGCPRQGQPRSANSQSITRHVTEPSQEQQKCLADSQLTPEGWAICTYCCMPLRFCGFFCHALCSITKATDNWYSVVESTWALESNYIYIQILACLSTVWNWASHTTSHLLALAYLSMQQRQP